MRSRSVFGLGFWSVVARTVLGPGARQGLSVLIFHRVHRQRDPLHPNEPTEAEFRRDMEFLAASFPILPLWDGVMTLAEAERPFHAVAITFDDGYADNVDVALPVLRDFDLPATFFVASGLLDGGIMWNDRIIEGIRGAVSEELDLRSLDLGRHDISTTECKREAARSLIRQLKYRRFEERESFAKRIGEACHGAPRSDLMMSSTQLRNLASYSKAEIGGHTVTHPILSLLSESDARREICECKEQLEAAIGRRLRCFAYPNGILGHDFDREHSDLVREAGFDLAVSTNPGGVHRSSNKFLLPRFTPWDQQMWRFGLRMLYVSRKDGSEAGAS